MGAKHRLTQACVSPAQTYPDLDKMIGAQLDDFLSHSALPEWEKAELLATTKRTEYYAKRLAGHRLMDAQAACREHHIYLKKSGIFILADVRSKFYELDNLMWDALTEHRVNEEVGQIPRMHNNIDALRQKGPELLNDLERVGAETTLEFYRVIIAAPGADVAGPPARSGPL